MSVDPHSDVCTAATVSYGHILYLPHEVRYTVMTLYGKHCAHGSSNSHVIVLENDYIRKDIVLILVLVSVLALCSVDILAVVVPARIL
jgi:hypothetical protein